MENSKIEWCDHTFNPWQICTPVSAGCANCYASARHERFTGEKYKSGVPRERTSQSYWKQPLKWNRDAQKSGVRARVFCASLADVFDAEAPAQWLGDLLCLIHETPSLDWLLLTKRPELFRARMEAVATNASDHLGSMLAWNWKHGHAPSNIWLGTSVENQQAADERIPFLLEIAAKIRFLSCEPLLGLVTLGSALEEHEVCGSCGDGSWYQGRRGCCGEPMSIQTPSIDWVIAGGESGPGARPMHPAWARQLRRECQATAVPFLFKQWGESVPDRDRTIRANSNQSFWMMPDGSTGDRQPEPQGCTWMARVGKKNTGRSLDGCTWDEFPKPVTEVFDSSEVIDLSCKI